MPGGDHQRGDGERDHERRPQVGLDDDEQERGAGGEEDRRDRLAEAAHPLGMVGQVAGDVENERQFHDLRGLELDGPDREPPAGAVDDDPEPGHQDQNEQRERAQQHEPAQLRGQQRQAAALEHLHRGQTDPAEYQVADELAGAAAAVRAEDAQR